MDVRDRATARLVPNDSDDYLFGTERSVLKELIEEGDKKITLKCQITKGGVSLVKPKASTSGTANSSFRDQGKKSQSKGNKSKSHGSGAKPQQSGGKQTIFDKANAARESRGEDPIKRQSKKKGGKGKKSSGQGDKQ